VETASTSNEPGTDDVIAEWRSWQFVRKPHNTIQSYVGMLAIAILAMVFISLGRKLVELPQILMTSLSWVLALIVVSVAYHFVFGWDYIGFGLRKTGEREQNCEL
jgi:hypothetical protein